MSASSAIPARARMRPVPGSSRIANDAGGPRVRSPSGLKRRDSPAGPQRRSDASVTAGPARVAGPRGPRDECREGSVELDGLGRRDGTGLPPVHEVRYPTGTHAARGPVPRRTQVAQRSLTPARDRLRSDLAPDPAAAAGSDHGRASEPRVHRISVSQAGPRRGGTPSFGTWSRAPGRRVPIAPGDSNTPEFEPAEKSTTGSSTLTTTLKGPCPFDSRSPSTPAIPSA